MEEEKKHYTDAILERKVWSVDFEEGGKKFSYDVIAPDEETAMYIAKDGDPKLADNDTVKVSECLGSDSVLLSLRDIVNEGLKVSEDMDYEQTMSLGLFPPPVMYTDEFTEEQLSAQIEHTSHALLNSLPRKSETSDEGNTQMCMDIAIAGLEAMMKGFYSLLPEDKRNGMTRRNLWDVILKHANVDDSQLFGN